MMTPPIIRHPATGVSLGRWLLLSATVHALLLIGWNSVPLFPGQREAVLSVALTPGEIVPIPSPRLSDSARSTPVKKKEGQPEARRSVVANVEADPGKKSPDPSTTTDSHGQAAKDAAARIRASLLSDLSHHFEYPLQARLRGWEGTVLVGLDIEADGFLHQVHLARSSGYDVLDQSAIEAVRRVGRLRDASVWSGHGRQHVRLPVIYRLTER